MAAWIDPQPADAGPPRRRLAIVVRADPVICGHSGEARNLAEAALHRGFTEVRIVTWPLDLLESSGLPLKPLDGVLPYSEGIEVERPEPVGDYKVPDGRHLAGMTGRLVELFTDGVPTVCISLYLSPHTIAVSDALRVAENHGPAGSGHHHRRGRGLGRDQRRPLLRDRRPVRGRGPGALDVPGQRPAGGGVRLHPAADHLLGRRDRRPARHHVRRPVPAAGDGLLPGRQHRGLPRPGSRRDQPGAGRPAGWPARATCCSCPGWPTPRGSTT